MALLKIASPQQSPAKSRRGNQSHSRKNRAVSTNTRDNCAGAAGTVPAAAMTFFPGGEIQLSPSIPTSVGANPLSRAHLTIASALLARGSAPASFTSSRLTSSAAARVIENAFEAEIKKILSRIDEEFISLDVTVYLSDSSQALNILITVNDCTVLTPAWLDDENINPNLKSAVWDALSANLPKILRVGILKDLIEAYSEYNWDGAKTDDEARKNMIDMFEVESDDIWLLPSSFKDATPAWISDPPDSYRPLPSDIVDAIRAVEVAAEHFTTTPEAAAAWTYDFETVSEIEPRYEESVPTPPLWLVPLHDTFIDALNQITEHGMQTCFYDVCGAATLSTENQVSQWLVNLAQGADFIAALARLLAITPKEVSNAPT